jgi:ABC-type sulfate transport system substrate-binding protein
MMPVLKSMMADIRKGKKTTVVTFNTRHNLSTLISFWDDAAKDRDLCIIFVNPESSADRKWIIYPYTHNKISDESSLEEGLKSIFETVEPLDDRKIREICKGQT